MPCRARKGPLCPWKPSNATTKHCSRRWARTPGFGTWTPCGRVSAGRSFAPFPATGKREALEARRTLAYSFGTIAGDEQLLKDLFTASVRTKVLHTDPSNGRRTVSLTNGSSVEYVLRFPGQNPVVLKPFSTLMTTVGRDKPLDVTVENMWYSEKDHPRIEINL